MKVSSLLKALSALPPDTEVAIGSTHGGYVSAVESVSSNTYDTCQPGQQNTVVVFYPAEEVLDVEDAGGDLQEPYLVKSYELV
jgi:hypothetical protein